MELRIVLVRDPEATELTPLKFLSELEDSAKRNGLKIAVIELELE